jgi:hypothetical protein
VMPFRGKSNFSHSAALMRISTFHLGLRMKTVLLSVFCAALISGCSKSKDELAMEQYIKEVKAAEQRSTEIKAHAREGMTKHSTAQPVPRPGEFPRQGANGSGNNSQPANP